MTPATGHLAAAAGLIVAFLALPPLSLAVNYGEVAPWPGLLLSLTGWGLALGLAGWQAVALWRRGGIPRPVLTRALAGAGALAALAWSGWVGLPILRDQARLVAGDAALGRLEVRASADGREIALNGAIVGGAAGALRRQLLATPQARLVRLHSPGGRIGEARRLQQTIRQAGLDTYAPVLCASACTIAFLGGRNRYVGATARIGFHASRVPGLSDLHTAGWNRRILDHVVALGVDETFARAVYLSPASDMLYPPPAELLRAGFATAITEGPPPDRKDQRQ